MTEQTLETVSTELEKLSIDIVTGQREAKNEDLHYLAKQGRNVRIRKQLPVLQD